MGIRKLLLGLGLGALLAGAGVSNAAPTRFDLVMTGAAEAAAGAATFDPDALGVGHVTIDPDTLTLSWDITYSNANGANISGFHIHGPNATLTTNASIFIDLDRVNSTDPTLNLLTSTSTPDGRQFGSRNTLSRPNATFTTWESQLNAVLANPTGFYLNLHTANPGGFPGGVVRAQLPEPGTLSLLAVGALAMLGRRRRA